MSSSSGRVADVSHEFPRTRRRALRRLVVASVSALALLAPMLSLASPAQADTAPLPPVTVPTVSADALPTVQINGVAWDQVVVGNTVYVTGEFTSARPAGSPAGTNEVARTNLLAYNITTGVLNTVWKPTLNGKGATIAASTDGTRIFVGGSFTSVSGTTRNRVVALDATSGAVITTWNPSSNARIRALAVSGTTLYMGGIFTTVAGQPRTRLAAVSTATGALTAWAPAVDAEVMALAAPAGSGKVVAGGKFATATTPAAPGPQDAYGMAALNATTGEQMPWAIGATVRNAGADAAVYSLNTDGNQVYGTGYTFGGGGNFEGTFAARASDGATVFVTGCRGDTYDAAPIGNVLYYVSHTHDCSMVGGNPQTEPWTFARASAETITAAPSGLTNAGGNFGGRPAPELLHWQPTLDVGTVTGSTQAAWSVTGNSNYVVLGGEFPRVNNTPQAGLVRFAVTGLAPNTQGPQGGGELAPTLISLTSGRVRVSWKAAWDRDNRKLTYDVLRGASAGSAVSVATLTQDSAWYSRPQMFFNDQTAAPGTNQTYRIRVRDAFGNTVTGSAATITVPAGGTSSVYANQVLSDGADHLWRLGEGSGTSAYDYEAADDLTLDPSATRNAPGAMVNDSTARSTTFSGTANVPAVTPTAVPGTTSFSQEAWFRTTSTSGGKIIGFGNNNTGDSGNYDRHVYMRNDGRIVFGVHPGGVRILTSPLPYNDGQWHQVVANLGSTGMELYLDGKRVARDVGVTGAQDYTGFWRIGGDNLNGWPSQPSSNKFAGGIEDVAIYPAPLTLAQVQSHYQASGRSLNLPTRPADAYGAAVWDAGPSIYWRLDEAAGSSVAVDRMTNEPSGTYSSGVVRAQTGAPANPAGSSISFPGNSTQAVVANTAVNNPTTYSVETWFKSTSTNGGRLIGFGNSGDPNGTSSGYDRYIWMLNNGTLRYGIYNGNTTTIGSSQSYNDGQWHLAVATQSSGGMRLYVDGVLVDSGPTTGPQNYSGYWRLGTDNVWFDASRDFNGSLDEAAIYDTALTGATVDQHYQLGKPAAANVAPTAAFSSTSSGLTASFDGSASADSDGTIASYAWQFGDGQTGTGVSPNHAYAAAGTYTAVLTVTDDDGATASVNHPVTVTVPANVAPTAEFTATTDKLKATFSSAGSSDPDGSIASYAWQFGDGAISSQANPVHTYTTAGTYPAVLTVTDNQGATGTVTHNVVVTANAAPTAGFSSACTNLVCDFDGSGSDDPDGTIASYAWDFGDGGTSTQATPSHTFTAGTHTVELTVTDNDGASDSMSAQVTVTAENVSPTAEFVATGTGLSRNFNASASADSDGTIVSYAWNFGDSQVGTGVTTAHTYTAPGTYMVTLTVTDNLGAIGTTAEPVTVTAPNVAPVADFDASCPGLTCSFDAGDSADSDGSIASYAWTFGDGGTGTGVATNHTYAAGTYSVTLTVTDNDGATGTRTRTVTPAPTPNQPPTARFTHTESNLTVSLNSSTSTDPDNAIVSSAWNFGDSQNGAGTATSHTYAAAGTYTVVLTVTDASGATDTVAEQVTVTAAPVNQAPVARFTADCTNLACDLDAGTSTDDTSIASYAWAFGDTTSGTGETVAHTFPAAGSYTVTLTVTDGQGLANSTSRVVTVTAGPAVLVSDTFGRTVASGFGTADSGTAWAYKGTGTTASVAAGSGRVSLGAGLTAYLRQSGVSNLNTDVTHTVWTESMPTGGGTFLATVARGTAAGDYFAQVKVLSSGAVNLGLSRTGAAIGTSSTVPGLTYTVGSKLRVRVQATGSAPTLIRAKVWLAGTTEPANWMVSATDTTAGYQVAGSVGLLPYLSGSATSSLVVRYDDFVAASTN